MQVSNTQSRKSRKNKSRKFGRTQTPMFNIMSNVPSYANQPLATLIVPYAPVRLSVAVTTGLLAQSFQLDLTLVTNWSGRFPTLFEECRIVKARAIIDFFTSSNPGLLKAYWDEKVPFTTPTVTSVSERSTFQSSLGGVDRPLVMTWVPKNLNDLQYSVTSSPNIPAALCLYTDNANFGSPIVQQSVAALSIEYTVQFRGYETE
jgi:hypothetical protein